MSKQKKYHYIYKTTCQVTGKFYVGMHSTDNLDDAYLGSGKILGYSISKHGKENHVKEILEYCSSRDELKNREKEIVNEELLQNPLNINLKYGGEGGWDSFNDSSELHRERCSQAGKKGGSITGAANLSASRLKNPDTFKNASIKAGQKMGPVNVLSMQTVKAKAKRSNTMRERNHQRGESNSNFGKRNRVINRDGINKRISTDLVDEFLVDGWKTGFFKG